MNRTGSIALEGAQVWEGREKGFADRDLVIVDGRVTRAQASEGTDASLDRVNASGTWIIPGLIDAHFHAYALSMDGFENERGPLSYAALNGARRLSGALARGFTTVRDVAGGDIGLRRAVDSGLIDSPRYLFTGPALSQTGGHGDPRAEHIDVCFGHGHMCEVVDGVDALRLAVRDRLRTGAHAIKVMTSGGVFSLTDPVRVPQYSAEELQAVSDEARRRGTYVTAHSYSVESVMHSIVNGITCIEHGNLIDSDTAAEMARRGVSLVPTLATYDAMACRGPELGLNPTSLAKNDEVLSKGKEAAQMALAAGVRVGFGTDLMGDMEDEQLAGVRLQVEALGAAEALHSMTVGNAGIFGDPDLGHLGEGARGDAVVLTGNPLEDPEVLWEQGARRMVIQSGRAMA
ncbi:metal-dependent hydrolase family protein [Brevibacterium casei]|uniref:metal-dependent hydrolase family protein n=1 Tax=Brevibacterium casei TaxID=33889 RepID=UPI0036FDE8C4